MQKSEIKSNVKSHIRSQVHLAFQVEDKYNIDVKYIAIVQI